jgi:hypothetical protein
MSSERVIHSRVKYLVARAFERTLERAGAPCQFLLDGALVRIDRHRSYRPDVLVYCGQPLPDDAIEVPNPVVVVEVLSPSNAMKDLRDKLVGYLLGPASCTISLSIPTTAWSSITPAAGDAIATRIVSDGSSLQLDPPGLRTAVAEFFPAAASET